MRHAEHHKDSTGEFQVHDTSSSAARTRSAQPRAAHSFRPSLATTLRPAATGNAHTKSPDVTTTKRYGERASIRVAGREGPAAQRCHAVLAPQVGA
jgi:hypothetical protein